MAYKPYEEILEEAVAVAQAAAEEQLKKLSAAGPAFAVVNDPDVMGNSNVVGTMLDVCGFSSMSFKCKGKNRIFYRYLQKRFTGKDRWGETVIQGKNWSLQKSSYGSGIDVSLNYPLKMRQEMSVKDEALHAAAKHLELYGIITYVQSRID